MLAATSTPSWKRFSYVAAGLCAVLSGLRVLATRPIASGVSPGGVGMISGGGIATRPGMSSSGEGGVGRGVQEGGFVAKLERVGENAVRADISTETGAAISWAEAIALWFVPAHIPRSLQRVSALRSSRQLPWIGERENRRLLHPQRFIRIAQHSGGGHSVSELNAGR